MPIFQHIPAILKVSIVFALVLFGIRKKLSLGNAFLLGAIALSILFGLKPFKIIDSMVNSVIYPKTLSLAIIVGLILILSNSMEVAGQMKRLLERFRGLVASPRLNLVIFPAMIGLLPMPGGAIFSAPMVKELGVHSRLSADQLSFINYWFRHIWEYWWPMYPGVLLATIMADLNIAVFVMFMFPLTIVAVYAGWRPIKGLENSEEAGGVRERPPWWPFIRELAPIIIVILPGLGLGMLFSFAFPNIVIAKESGLIISLCMAIAWIWHVNAFSMDRIWKILNNRNLIKMVYMVFAILIFKGILGDSDAVKEISRELMMLKIPLVLIAVVLPFLVGMITGITIAFVGSTFPILIPLIHSQGETSFMLAYIMLALACGFAGVLLSPLHLCLILSNEYFGTPPGPVYKNLWVPCVWLMISGFVYFWILHWGYGWFFGV
ncbi:DUF401 family protein [Thermodesulfobacteriota bacterium]